MKCHLKIVHCSVFENFSYIPSDLQRLFSTASNPLCQYTLQKYVDSVDLEIEEGEHSIDCYRGSVKVR